MQGMPCLRRCVLMERQLPHVLAAYMQVAPREPARPRHEQPDQDAGRDHRRPR